MPLSPGQTLASYEILALLGQGGMGEVYRARDPNLDREVAIKVLPEVLAQDEERILRFEREAKVLASLSHAHIGAIHGFESVDATRFLILEFVEGESLAQRLRRGPLPIEEALEVCRQIAEALEAAHEKGIVHRDLKPANVQLKPDGTVKVLDFGLARAMVDETSGSATTDSPTITADFTRPGVVLGTAPYMSPEQARGKTVDKRADIWAFGCCLYEALSGQQAFHGETVTDLFADIIKGEPDWKALPRESPWKLREILERCLAKDPNQRLRDIGDARIELRRLSTESGSLTAAAEMTAAPGRSRPGRLVAFALGGVVVGAGLFQGVSSLFAQPDVVPVRQLAVGMSDVPSGYLAEPMLSRDGNQLIFQAAGEGGYLSRSWFVHDFSSRVTRPIPGIPSAVDKVFLSPDSSMVTFVQHRVFKEARLDGGPALEIARGDVDGVGGPIRGAVWNTDRDMLLVMGDPRTLYSLALGGTEPRPVYTAEDPSVAFANPVALPGGRGVLLTLGVNARSPEYGVGILDLESLELSRLIEGASDPLYVRTGHLLYIQDARLMAVRFNPETFELLGERIPVPIGGIEVGIQGNAWYAVSPEEGALVFLPGSTLDLGEIADSAARFRWLGEDTPVLESVSMGLDFALSRDGRWLAVSTFADAEQGALPRSEILLYDLDRLTDPHVRLARGLLQHGLGFSPDGEWLTYAQLDNGPPKLFAIPVQERQPDPQPLVQRDGGQIPHSWTPDSRAILFQDGRPQELDVMRIALGGGEPEPVLSGPDLEGSPALSPDGTLLAFLANLDGQPPGVLDLYVGHYPPSDREERITTGGAGNPQWHEDEDGLHLYYTVGGMRGSGAGGALHSVVITVSDGQILKGSTEVLLEGTNDWRMERVAGDGRILVMESLGNEEFSGFPRSPLAGDQFVYIANFLDWLEQLDPRR